MVPRILHLHPKTYKRLIRLRTAAKRLLAQLSQLRAIFGIFAFNFIGKSSVSIAEL